MATFGFGSGSSSSNRDRKDRSKLRKIKQLRRSMLETLEVRNLMTTGPDLIGIQPNEGSVLALGATSKPTVLNVSPREMILRFGDGAEIDARTLSGIQIKRSGGDGALSSAYLTTDLGTNAAAVFDFSASLPGQQGNGTQIRFIKSTRTTGSNDKPASFPLISVRGQQITIDVNIAPNSKTTAGELLEAMQNDASAKALVVTSLLRGSTAVAIADTVPTDRALTLIGADSARASTNFNSGDASLQVEFVSVNTAATGAGVRIEFSSRVFDVPGPPNVLVNGRTIRVELNSAARAQTTVQEVLNAINGSRDASALVAARLVSGSAFTRIGGFAVNYSPLILTGGDDQLVTPAFIGLGDTRREVIVRFGEALPDDSYLIDILGTGSFALRDIAGFAFNGGVSKSVRFDLDLGPTVQSVVPQPVVVTGGVRSQLRNVIHVYFNGDKLNAVEAVKPLYYQLVYTGDTLTGADDIVFRPLAVNYEASLNRVALSFDRNLDQLVNPSIPGSAVLPLTALRLRIGNDQTAVNTSVTPVNPAADPGDQFNTAFDLNLGGGWLAGAQTTAAIISSEIKNMSPYVLDYPGANDEPSNRNNRYQQHITRVDNDGIEVVYYNFASTLGNANKSLQLNAITEVQKVMVRQVMSMYERYFGARFVESENQGFIVAVGDMQAIDPATALTPVETNGNGGKTFAAGPLLANSSQSAVIIDSQDFNSASENLFGSELFRSFMRGIGVLLGLGNADELPQSTIQNNNPITDPRVENVFPGNADIIHGQYLFRPESRDIDLYRFTLPAQGGKLSLQVSAERQTDSSLLDAALRLYRNEGSSSSPRWVEVAANDDYFSKDPRIELEVVSDGREYQYAVGVSAKGNNSYDPSIADSGLGGRSEGKYQLRIDYRPPAASTLVDADVDAPTPLDGDGDGRPGGVFNYWFVPTRPDRVSDLASAITLWVDKTASNGGTGTLAAPYNNISQALIQANTLATQDTTGKRVIAVRILGNSQNRAYEIGFNRFGQAMADGSSFDVPRNVNVMIDAGAIIKLGRSRISVGSSTVSVNRNGGSLQLLGIPDSKVIVTSLNDTVGIGVNPDRTPPAAAPGDWGGIDFRNRIDGSDETRIDKERAGLFLNAVVHSDIRFGGGQVLVDGVSQVITPIHMIDSRPTIANSLVTRSADAAMSATPNSFREDDYRDPRSQASGAFIPDYERIGPDIRGNRVVNNTINGLTIKTRTGAGETLETVNAAVRFNEVDIPYVLSENLVVAGTPGGGILDVASPPSTIVVLSELAGGILADGRYNYRLVYVDSNGNESLASTPTESITVSGSSKISLTNLPPISSTLPYVGRRIYRSDRGGIGPYRLVAQINATATTFVDDGTTSGNVLVELSAKIRPRLDGSLVIDPGSVIKNRGARIEVRDGGVLIAEGTASRPIIMTSVNDASYGSGGTFDTAGNRGTTLPQRGDWGGIFVGHGGSGALDYVRLAFGGGTSRIEGGFASFNSIEVHQADFRMTNSSVEKSETGNLSNAADPTRGGRGTNEDAAVFVRGSQPILVNNRFRDNNGSVISIDVNSLDNQYINDPGRSTGFLQRTGEYLDNHGPLIRGNTLSNNSINGVKVRAQTLTTESVWDDTDIVHVVLDDIPVPDFHTYGGLRLESSDQQSLVVKFLNQSDEDSGLTASGRGQDIADRIGGSVQLVGRPGSPVVLTSLNDCTIGAGFTVEGFPQNDTLNTRLCSGVSAIPYADVLVVMDESSSMAPAQDFSVGLIADLDAALIRAGVGSASAGGNLFGLVGYGDDNVVPRAIPVGPNGGLWGTSAEYGTAANNNLRDDGITEDGYLALDFAMSRYTFRPGAERFVILVTNEDRDIVDDTKTYSSTLSALQQSGVRLQGIVSAFFTDARGDEALALDNDYTAYKEDGAGGFTSSPGGIIQVASGTTQPDYIDMVFALGGIVGDINQIQAGGLTATSFSQVLVTSIVQQTGVENASPGDWRGVLMETYSNDRNVAIVSELEAPGASARAENDIPSRSQYVGQLAKNITSGDENTRLAFDVNGVINKPSDVDVYSFTAFGGTEVWLDIDRTAANIDTVVELISADGEILALSDSSYLEEMSAATNPLFSILPGNSVNPLRRSSRNLYPQSSRGEPRDDYSTNVKDAGMRVVLPGQPSQATLYHVRVRTSNQFPGQGAGTPALTNPASVGQGRTRGAYNLQIRLREQQEIGGSSINQADIRFATNAIKLEGVPRHSPLLGETGEIGGDTSNAANNTAGPNNTFFTAQDLGNLLQTDRKTISIAGSLASANDVDWFTFTIDYPTLQTPLREYLSTIFDLDYADGIGRADMAMYLFSSDGSLISFGENSNILDDRHASISIANTSDLGRGSIGTLDPFIGPTELAGGRYYLALTNRTQVPTVLNNRLNTAIGNANLRILPVSSSRLLVEDRIGDAGSSTVPPINSQFLNLSSRVEYTLGDVPIYFSQSNAQTSTFLGNPFTGQIGHRVGAANNEEMRDTFIRPNGDYRGYSQNRIIRGANPPTVIHPYVLIDPATGAGARTGGANDDGIQFLVNPNRTTPMTIEASTVMPIGSTDIDTVEYGFLVANRARGFGETNAYFENIVYRFDPNTGFGLSSPAPGGFGNAGAGTSLAERGFINTNSLQGIAQTRLAFAEATRSISRTGQPLINDGDSFTILATVGGRPVTLVYEFNSGPELFLNFAPNAALPRALEQGDQFSIDGVTYQIETSSTPVTTPGVRTVFYNKLMNNEQFAAAVRQAVPATIQVGFDGNRLNFSGATNANFTTLVDVRRVATQSAATGTVRGQVPINFLAQDTAETIAARVARAINAQGLTGISATPGGLRNNEVVLQGPATVSATVSSASGIYSPGQLDPNGTITGIAGIDGDLFAISNVGGLYRVGRSQLITNTPGAIGSYVDSSYELRGIQFTGLSRGPANVAGGVYSNILFGMTATGRVYAFDTNGFLQGVFANGATFVDTGISGLNGIAFSNLDFNLWHTTDRRGTNPGHGVEEDASAFRNATSYNIRDFQTTRSPITVSGVAQNITDVNVTINVSHTWLGDLNVVLVGPSGVRVPLALRVGGNGDDFVNTTFDDEASTPIGAGTAPFTGSFRPSRPLSVFDGGIANGTWFLEIEDVAAQDIGTLLNWSINFLEKPSTTSWYFGFEGGAAHGNADLIGALDPGAQPRAFGRPLQSSYNFPGGAVGVLESQPISLAGISSADLPTLYFNYFLSSDQGSQVPDRSDSFRVYAAGDNGAWTLLNTNIVPNTTTPIRDGTIPEPSVTVPSVAWRQARVSLSELAGNREVRFRFEFSTAGGLGFGSTSGRGSELRTVAGSQLRDGQIFTVNGQLFEIEMGTTLVFPSGAGITNGETLTVAGATFVFWNGTGTRPSGNVIPFSATDSPTEVANAALAAINAVQLPFDEITRNLNPEPVSGNNILSTAAVLTSSPIRNQTRFTVNGAIGDIGDLIDQPNPRDVDIMRVSLEAGTTLNIQVSGKEVGSPLNPLVRLFDSQGNEIRRASIPTEGPGSKDLSAVLIETIGVAGDYFIGVSSTSINDYSPSIEEGRTAIGSTGLTGFYRLKMDAIPSSAVSTQRIDLNLAPETVDRNETTTTAIPVNNSPGLRTRVFGNGQIGDFVLRPGENPEILRRDVDMLRVNMEAGARLNVRVAVAEVPTPLNPLIRVFDPRGIEIGRASELVNGPGSDDLYVEFSGTVSASGAYFIGISNKEINDYDPAVDSGRESSGATGTYRIETEIIPSSAIVSIDNRLPLFALTPVSLSAGSRIRVEGNLGVGYEVQQVAATGNPTGGTFTLRLRAGGTTAVTAAIPWNATAAQLQAALEDLPNVNVGDVIVGGVALPGGALTVSFQGALANANLEQMVDDDSRMIGGGISVTTIKDRNLGTIPVQILSNMTSAEVAAAVARALELSLSSSLDQFPTISRQGNALDMTGYTVESSGPFSLTNARVGDENWSSEARARSNAFEGVFLDDIIIGLAERGEVVTGAVGGAGADTSFTQVSSPGSEILVGTYQLEIRSGSDYGVPTRNGISLNRAFDPNQALSDSVEIRFNDASKISDGSTIVLNDGINTITMEFDDVSSPIGSLGRGVRPGNVAIPFNPIAGESAEVIAQRFLNAVNSTVVQSVLTIGALASNGSTNGLNAKDVSLVGRINVTIDSDIGFIFNRSPKLRFQDSSQLSDGDTIRIEDSENSVILEFSDTTILPGFPNFGVRAGNIAIPFDSTVRESAITIATRVLAVINSSSVQSRVRVSAAPVAGLGGQASDSILVGGAVGVFTSSNVGTVIPASLFGDRNTQRDQGQIVVENSRISNSEEFGISITAGARDLGSNTPNPGSVRNLLTINNQRLIPGAVIVNNELVGNSLGGINIEGDTNSSVGVPPAAVPFARIVNNTIVGGRVSTVPVPVPTTVDGLFYEAGNISFADSVVLYNALAGGGPAPLAGLRDSSEALGAPDYEGVGEPRPNQGVVSLGRGGVLVVRFDDNILTGSDDLSPDLAVYEVGGAELVRVEVSSDGVNYTSVGTASFNSPLIDIDRYGFNSLSQLHYVRLTDEPDEGGVSGDSVGADIDAVGAISSRGGYEFVPNGTGIRIGSNASPTLLNNIVVNNVNGIEIAPTSSTTVVGGTLYQYNTRNVTGAPVGQYPIVVPNGVPLFTRPDRRNFYPIPGSPSIDSSIDSLLDRSSMLSVKQPVGLAPSPIIAPSRDIYGALRVDDPAVVAPPGLGESIFKERGASDRSDFLGPIAVSVNPSDNDASGLDGNPAQNEIELVTSNLQYFEIQLIDASDLNGVDQGTDIDPATVISSALSVSKNGVRLVEGRDYRFGYDATSNVIRLSALSGLWESGAIYTIRFVNSKEHIIRGVTPERLVDGSIYTVLDGNASVHYFEIETGVRLNVPVSENGLTSGIVDGDFFRISDGVNEVRFEFDSDGVASTGAEVITFNPEDSSSTLAEKIVEAINASGLNLTAKTYGEGNFQILSEVQIEFIPETSGIPFFGETGITPPYGFRIEAIAGVPQGIFDGQTFSVQRGGRSATFEFDGNATTRPGNIAVGLSTSSVSSQASLIASAINSSGLGVVATANASGYISVGTDPSVRVSAENSGLIVVGISGRSGTTPIVIDLSTVETAEQVAERIQVVIDEANLPGVDPLLIASDVYMNGVAGLTGVGTVSVLGIRDRAGNPMRATELNGETLINIFLGEGFDYGDAPDPSYSTLRDNNGPRHKVVSGFSLGQLVSADPDARLTDADNDDGVTFQPIVTGFTGSMQFTVNGITLARPGYVSAWIDFDGDGIFEGSEKINITGRIVNGTNSVAFRVPGFAISSQPVAARIRFSSDALAIAAPTGDAPDGEVEDYMVTIARNPYTNPNNRHDVNGDTFVSPIDVLQLVNYINAGLPPVPPIPPVSAPPYLDVNSDGFINALDVLAVINFINNNLPGGRGGEGEGAGGLGDLWVAAPTPLAPPDNRGTSDSGSIAASQTALRGAHKSLDLFLASLGNQEMGPLPADDSIDVISSSSATSRGDEEESDLDDALSVVLQELL